MPYRFVKVAREDHLTLITIERADVLNALHPPAHHELATAFDEFASDPAQWIAIITGSGTRAFCAGNDLKHRAAAGRQPLPASGFAGLTMRFDMYKPIIAAVNGLALGGGFEAALACDLIIADENAQFGLPEVKIGLAALAGGLQRLRDHGSRSPRRVGSETNHAVRFARTRPVDRDAAPGTISCRAGDARLRGCLRGRTRVRGTTSAAVARPMTQASSRCIGRQGRERD